MQIRTCLIVFVFMMILLSGFRCSREYPLYNEEAEEMLRTKFLTTFVRHFGVIPEYADAKKNKVKAIHVVSRRLVPGGPDPLHNWLG